MNGPHLPEGVGMTALFAAYARAQETRRPDRLFEDPLAAQFIGHALGAEISTRPLPRLGAAREDENSPLWNGLFAIFTGRTGFYDSYVQDRAEAGVRQFVILGAGLDTRAFRLQLPADAVVYEVDTHQVLEFKEKTLHDLGVEATVKRVLVDTDLRDDWRSALRGAGFDPAAPIAWLTEGLLMYFDPAGADRFLDEIGGLSPAGSTLAGEYLTRPARLSDLPEVDENDRAVAEIFISADLGGPQEWPPPVWLTAHGWSGDGPDLVDELTAAGRPVPELIDPGKPDPLRVRMFSATREAGTAR